MTQKERLVELLRKEYGSDVWLGATKCGFNSAQTKITGIETVADYLLANGIIVPPCKVGDTVYILWPPNQNDAQIIQGEVIGFSVGMKDEVYISNINYCGCFCRPFSEVFVYREAAEQALKERETK